MKRGTKSADKGRGPAKQRRPAKLQSSYKRENPTWDPTVDISSPDKSVSFAHKVKVREYGSKSKKRGKSAEHSRARVSRQPLKENFTPAQHSTHMHGSFMPSAATAADSHLQNSSGLYQPSHGHQPTSQFGQQTAGGYSAHDMSAGNETGFPSQYQPAMPRGQSPLRQSRGSRSPTPDHQLEATRQPEATDYRRSDVSPLRQSTNLGGQTQEPPHSYSHSANLRRKMSPSGLQQKDDIERKELNLIDVV